MYLLALTLCVAVLFTQEVFGGNTQFGRSKHKCLRDNDGVAKECVHQGKMINEKDCAKRCARFLKEVKYIGRMEAICANFNECSCIYYPNDSVIECDSLDNLEESYYRKMKRAKFQQDQIVGADLIGPPYTMDYAEPDVANNPNYFSGSTKKCFYRGELISAEECHKRCFDFSENTHFIGTAKGVCDDGSGCVCQSFSGEFVSWNRLDTLEAQYERKVADEDAKESKKKSRKRKEPTYTRLGIEMHNQASCSWVVPDHELEELDFTEAQLSE